MDKREQIRDHLSGLLNGTVWLQGFSEPGAGPDLALSTTRAMCDGDHQVVNGQQF